MHSETIPRRRHSAELKAKILAACNEPGASIAAVAMSHGLNANLVRKWLVGRGLKRSGIGNPVAVAASAPATASPASAPLFAADLSTDVRFLPIELDAPTQTARAEPARGRDATSAVQEPIHIELRRGPLQLSVRWPASAARDCTAWLRELTAGMVK